MISFEIHKWWWNHGLSANIRSKTIWYYLMLDSIYLMLDILQNILFWIHYLYKIQSDVQTCEQCQYYISVNILSLGTSYGQKTGGKGKSVRMSTILLAEVKVLPNYDLEQISWLLCIKSRRTSARRRPPKCQGQVLGEDTGDGGACILSKLKIRNS